MAKSGAPKDVEVGAKFKRPLPCPISPAVADKKSREIVDVLTEINVQKEKAKPYKDKIRELTLNVESLRHDIKSKTEEREVTCVEERHYKRRAVVIRRLDLPKTDPASIVEERAMTDEDRSPELPDLGPAGKRGGKVLPLKKQETDADPRGPAKTPGEATTRAREEEQGGEEPPAS